MDAAMDEMDDLCVCKARYGVVEVIPWVILAALEVGLDTVMARDEVAACAALRLQCDDSCRCRVGFEA
jgi:hypothetical protein